jgi:hypothetical protein
MLISFLPTDQTDHALGDPARRLFKFLEKKGLWSEAQDAEFATVCFSPPSIEPSFSLG